MGKKNHVIVVVIGAKGPLKAASINKSLPIFQRAVRENVLQPEHPGITHALFGLLSLTAEAVQTAVIWKKKEKRITIITVTFIHNVIINENKYHYDTDAASVF